MPTVLLAGLIWLALHSRWDIPCVNIAIFGPPAVGKTSMVADVLRLFPETMIEETTRLSPKSLGYEKGNMKNRYLYVQEYDGAEGEDGMTIRLDHGSIDAIQRCSGHRTKRPQSPVLPHLPLDPQRSYTAETS